MVNESAPDEARPAPPLLKVEEPKIDPDKPWCDDELDRQEIADRLTTVIKDQEAPFVLSLDGRWGTGKTFLLKRWKAQLVKDGFQAIYFNAWEDDFCDDPLLAIIGQLSEHFDDGSFRELAIKVAKLALGLITKQLTGTAIDVTDIAPESLLDEYHEQRRTKQEMKEQMCALADQVKQETGKPLVFIIDELDRCRPTFAIELLERVKHIFDVDNIVFVLGINRTELVKSLESIYGKIDAGVYLRRFFDMEFMLPDADPVKFCAYLVKAYRLDFLFSELSGSRVSMFYGNEFSALSNALPTSLGRFGLSLRDMDYCIRLVALAGKGLQQGNSMFPEVIAILVAVKISNPELYQRFVQGRARAAEVVDYMDERGNSIGVDVQRPGLDESWQRDYIEAAMYLTDDGTLSRRQLLQLRDRDNQDQAGEGAKDLDRPEYLTKETREIDTQSEAGKERISNMVRIMETLGGRRSKYGISVPYLAELIDLYDSSLRQ